MIRAGLARATITASLRSSTAAEHASASWREMLSTTDCMTSELPAVEHHEAEPFERDEHPPYRGARRVRERRQLGQRHLPSLGVEQPHDPEAPREHLQVIRSGSVGCRPIGIRPAHPWHAMISQAPSRTALHPQIASRNLRSQIPISSLIEQKLQKICAG